MMRKAPKTVDLSLILCLRNSEGKVSTLVRNSVQLATTLQSSTFAPPVDATGTSNISSPQSGSALSELDSRFGSEDYEILACDERSTDNTLSILSILFTQVPHLRSLQDLAPGSSLMRATHAARGKVWLIAADIFDLEHGAWAIEEIRNGKRAAMVPDELLALDHSFARDVFSWFRGELAAGQRKVIQELKIRGETAAWRSPSQFGLRARLGHYLRGRLGPLLLPLTKKSHSAS